MSGTISAGGNPAISQGNINRLRASVFIPNYPALNVTSPYLGKRGINISFTGQTTVQIDTMTGIVNSPEPYLHARVVMHLLRSQLFAQGYKTQMELYTQVGRATVRPDSDQMQPYLLHNCSILNVGDQPFDGSDPDYPITLGGIYYINSNLYLG
jgi:hypothetical protein